MKTSLVIGLGFLFLAATVSATTIEVNPTVPTQAVQSAKVTITEAYKRQHTADLSVERARSLFVAFTDCLGRAKAVEDLKAWEACEKKYSRDSSIQTGMLALPQWLAMKKQILNLAPAEIPWERYADLGEAQRVAHFGGSYSHEDGNVYRFWFSLLQVAEAQPLVLDFQYTDINED